MAKAPAKEMQRLDKIVSHLTGWSRQQATRLIKKGEVTVGNLVITDSAQRVSINEVITINGFNDELNHDKDLASTPVGELKARAVNGASLAHTASAVSAASALARRVFVLNKPNHHICADKDSNHSTVFSLLRSEHKLDSLHCAGRLDVDTSGVLIITDDGSLNHELTSPRKAITKVYLARVSEGLVPNAVERCAQGLKHPKEEKRYEGAKLTILGTTEALLEQFQQVSPAHSIAAARLKAAAAAAVPGVTTTRAAHDTTTMTEAHGAAEAPEVWVALELKQGRYHQVKRMIAVLGGVVEELVRVAVGSYTLKEELSLGSYARLTEDEVKSLFRSREYSQSDLTSLLHVYWRSLAQAPLTYIPERYAAVRMQELRAYTASTSAEATTSAIAAIGAATAATTGATTVAAAESAAAENAPAGSAASTDAGAASFSQLDSGEAKETMASSSCANASNSGASLDSGESFGPQDDEDDDAWDLYAAPGDDADGDADAYSDEDYSDEEYKYITEDDEYITEDDEYSDNADYSDTDENSEEEYGEDADSGDD